MRRTLIFCILCILAAGVLVALAHRSDSSAHPAPQPTVHAVAPGKRSHSAVAAAGATTNSVTHIFFHSLIVYPSEAAQDPKRRELLANNMLTVDQFKSVLSDLYKDNFVLVDPRSMFSVDADGSVHELAVSVPRGKKPLIISIDDLNYYETMAGDGMADKLVVKDGAIQAEVRTSAGTVIDTRDGDVVPILDAFIAAHPDFSQDGARGIIGLTGYDGVLGYRTQLPGGAGAAERVSAVRVAATLASEGWLFANHSFNHDESFLKGTISTSSLAADIAQWKSQVEPIVGPTNLYIGPFGQIFSPKDPRRAELVAAGYVALYGVGIDGYTHFYDTYFQQDRADIDGYRMQHDKAYLSRTFDIF